MNQDWRDRRIRELYHELREEDERAAPLFEARLEASPARGRLHRPTLGWRVAAAAAVPVVAIVLVLALLREDRIETRPPANGLVLPPLPNPSAGSDTVATAPPPKITVRPRSQKRASLTPRQVIRISQWHAPTDFLLKTPGSDFLRSLPRMPDSPPGIQRGLPDNHN